MSWTDKCALETIKKLRDFYEIEHFVETGTFKGINAEMHANNFEQVTTIESKWEYFKEAYRRLEKYHNVKTILGDSREVLPLIDNTAIYYLDAHFYNPDSERWVIKGELESIVKSDKSVIIIHDFNNGLGHCQYDGERLGMNVVGDLLNKINPKFHYYTNNLDFCDIMKPEETEDKVMKDNLNYAWSSPRLTYRGILYCTPTKLPKDFKLVEYERHIGCNNE